MHKYLLNQTIPKQWYWLTTVTLCNMQNFSRRIRGVTLQRTENYTASTVGRFSNSIQGLGGRGRGRPRKNQTYLDRTPNPRPETVLSDRDEAIVISSEHESEAVVLSSDNENVIREETPKMMLHYYRDVCTREGL